MLLALTAFAALQQPIQHQTVETSRHRPRFCGKAKEKGPGRFPLPALYRQQQKLKDQPL